MIDASIRRHAHLHHSVAIDRGSHPRQRVSRARAGDLLPTSLRSLDALHLAGALTIGSDLGAFITYDEHLQESALAQGLTVVAPN